MKKEEKNTVAQKSLEDYIPTFTDISNWQIDNQYNTGGSRSKKIVTNLTSGNIYFYKASKIDKYGEIRYPLEFWSEIVSSKIGQYLGFNILDYNIAFEKGDRQPVGCLSKSMIDFDRNKLTEGISYLTGTNNSYDPVIDQDKYTFQFIRSALVQFKLESQINQFIEMLVFDALISNSDRHQENWGFITIFQSWIDNINMALASKEFSLKNRIILRGIRWIAKYVKSRRFTDSTIVLQLQSILANRYSPIYDSGCCLGREVIDKKVKQLINDNQALEAYVSKGNSEVRWEGIDKKTNHYELLKRLLPEYKDTIVETINRCVEFYNEPLISQIVNNIDSKLPDHLSNYKLPKERKQLMIKILTLRLQKLKEII